MTMPYLVGGRVVLTLPLEQGGVGGGLNVGILDHDGAHALLEYFEPVYKTAPALKPAPALNKG